MPARTVTLPNHVQWIFRGNMNSNAIAIGDVDNDGLNEVIVASIHGELSVYKFLTGNGSWPDPDHDSHNNDAGHGHLLDSIDDDHAAWCCSPETTVPFGEPWLTASGLGSITSLSVGDIGTTGHNSIVAVSAEGSIHVFNVQLTDSGKCELILVLCTPAPLNVCRTLIADVDGDGRNELVLARTDRQVYVFLIHLSGAPDGPSESSSSSQTHFPSLHAKASNILAAAAASPGLFSSQSSTSSTPSTTIRPRRRTITAPPFPLPTGDSSHLPNVSPPTPSLTRATQGTYPGGQLELKARHGFPGQVGSLALLVRKASSESQRCLVVSQPSGTYVAIERDGKQSTVFIVPPRVGFDATPMSPTPRLNENSYLESLNRAMSFQPVRYSTSDLDPTPGMPSTSQFTGQVGTEVVVFSTNHGADDTLCVVTADGTLTFQFPDGTARSADLQVNHQLLHATHIGSIVVLCAFDGTTYLVDPTLQAVQVIGAPRTAAFAAGHVGVCPGVSRPCLIYAGFENGIRVVYDRALMTHLSQLGVQRVADAIPEVAHLSPEQLRELLYGLAQCTE